MKLKLTFMFEISFKYFFSEDPANEELNDICKQKFTPKKNTQGANQICSVCFSW